MLRFALSLWLCTTLVVATWNVDSSHAENDDAKLAAKKSLQLGDERLSQGDAMMDQGQVAKAIQSYEKALNAYQEAFKIFPDKKIYFPIASAEKKLGRFAEALEHYQALNAADLELSSPVQEQIAAGIAHTKENLVGFSPSVTPTGADLLIDGDFVGQTPLDQVVYVTPGVHSYEVRLKGYQSFEGEFDRTRGAFERPSISLRIVGSSTPKKTIPVEIPEEVPGDEASRVPLWTGLGATVVFAGAATVTGALAASEHNRFEDASLGTMEREDARKTGKNLAVATDVLVAGSVLAGAFTLYYYFTEVRGGSESTATDEVMVAPYASSDEAGMMLRGRF